ncbi:MAG: hypothetical protein ACT4P7_11775, partial [Gemmatimonadaceae bacterium]
MFIHRIRLRSAALVAIACAPSEEPQATSIAVPPELATQWTPPPGDALEHELAGFAKVLCSAIFVTGRSLQAAAEEDGHFVTPVASRALAKDTVVDRAARKVSVTLPNGTIRSAKFYGDQGCVTLPAGA